MSIIPYNCQKCLECNDNVFMQYYPQIPLVNSAASAMSGVSLELSLASPAAEDVAPKRIETSQRVLSQWVCLRWMHFVSVVDIVIIKIGLNSLSNI